MLDDEVPRHVRARVRLQQRRAGRHGIVGVEHDVQRLVLDVHQLGRVLGQVARLGHDHRHRLPRIAHDPIRERALQESRRRLVVEHAGGDRTPTVGQVLRRDHVDHAWRGARRVLLDPRESSVCEGAAHHERVDHVRALEVGDVHSLPPDQRPVLLAERRGPDAVQLAHPGGHLPSPPR